MANYAGRRQFSTIKTNEPSALKPAHELSDFLPGVIQTETSFHYLNSSFRGAFVRGRVFQGESSLEVHTCAYGGRPDITE